MKKVLVGGVLPASAALPVGPGGCPGRCLSFPPHGACRAGICLFPPRRLVGGFASFRRAAPAVLCVFPVPYPVKTETFPPGVDIFPDRVYNTLDSLC